MEKNSFFFFFDGLSVNFIPVFFRDTKAVRGSLANSVAAFDAFGSFNRPSNSAWDTCNKKVKQLIIH